MKRGFLIKYEEQFVNLSVLFRNTNYRSETINSNTVNLITRLIQSIDISFLTIDTMLNLNLFRFLITLIRIENVKSRNANSITSFCAYLSRYN